MTAKRKLTFRSALQLVILVERMLELDDRLEKLLFGSGEGYTSVAQRLFSRVSDEQLGMFEKRIQKVQRYTSPIALVEHDILTIIHAEQDARDMNVKTRKSKSAVRKITPADENLEDDRYEAAKAKPKPKVKPKPKDISSEEISDEEEDWLVKRMGGVTSIIP